MPKRRIRSAEPTWQGRFWSKVTKTDTCWVWTACTMKNGYGSYVMPGRTRLVHRIAYELCVGPIPMGFQIDHLCYVRNCVNPEHLEAVTGAENTRRAAARIARCPLGHEYSENNTYIRKESSGKPGGRMCKACHMLSERKRRERLRNEKTTQAIAR